MAEIFFTADTHFGHRGIIAMCDRPFYDVEDMDEGLIRRWNDRVRKSDIVYHLGDFTMGATAGRGREIFDRLNGRKHLIIGNHDREKVRTLPWASPPRDRLMLRHPEEKMPVVLDHYALRTWPSLHHGAIHLYGHSHGSLPGIGRSVDVGVDVWNYTPVTLNEIRRTLERQQAVLDDARAARAVSEMDDEARGDAHTSELPL
ncbi:metallophosphoesterase [Aurantimonas coralicida]|uniref:metallophosphoesterase n=1 Tax=Aurantimonas coralicida TaxID=182270 RepID=UPI001D180236|nr:metallophosphoesterase [Aurantimonas coralicida]MCC4300258.1 metallophosphoesterase [Aurantimonas coralicida]